MTDPKDIFKKFGQSARHTLITAQRIAQNMNSGIGTEHLLLAITVTAGNLSYDILKENAINLDQVKLILSLNNIKTNLTTGLSREAKETLALAAKQAQKLEHETIESEHILWAIVTNENCRGYQVINRIGVDTAEIKEQLEEIFSEIDTVDNLIDNNLEQMNTPNMPPQGFEFVIPQSKQFPGQKKSSSKTPLLDQYGIDLTKLAKNKQLDPLVGREAELKRTIQILCRRNKNNPVLVGEPGIGKTSIVEGLAQKIATKSVPPTLINKKIISLDLSSTVAGTMYRGQFEDRVKKIIAEVIKNKNIILFIDELHTIVGAGSAEGSIDAANILKPALAKGQIRIIGATTTDEYTKQIEKDKALERRFQVVKVNEPTVEETTNILNGIKSSYEKHHKIIITKEAITAASQLSTRYISDRFLPDKAIDLIDEAGAAKQTVLKTDISENKELNKLTKQINKIRSKKEAAADTQDYVAAAKLRSEEIKLQNIIKKITAKSKLKQKQSIVTEQDIAKVVSLWTGIPIENLIETEKSKFINLEQDLKQTIIGQPTAISSVTNAIKRSKSKISNPNRPISTFIFLGPTGVGKTQLTKELAKTVFNHSDALIKLDMSEYMEKHNVAKLIGAPPGYVGYDEPAKLTEKVRRNPYSVVLFDEIEKAHPEVFNILLQILEDGELTDSKGRKINFKNTIIILTSNIGLSQLNQQAAIGFNTTSQIAKFDRIKSTILDQLQRDFKPELLNRIDDIIVFNPLSKENIAAITKLQLNQLTNRLSAQSINLEINKSVVDYIANIGYEPKFGAREVRRKIAQYVEDPLSDQLLTGKLTTNSKIRVTVKNKQIVFTNSK